MGFLLNSYILAGAGGGGIESAAGSAAGTGAVSGIAASIFAGLGSGSGSGAVAGIGSSIAEAPGSASGTSSAAGDGFGGTPADGSASGGGAVSGVGEAVSAAGGSANGTGAGSGVGASIVDAMGSGAGTGAAQASSPAIEFVGRASTATGADAADQVISLTSLTGGSRSSVAEGDIVIAVYQASVNSDLALVIEDPSATAYTLIDSEAYVNNGSDTNLRVAYKIMGITPDASVTFKTTSGSSNNSRIHTVYVFSGVDTTTPMDVTPTSSSAGNTVIVNPAAITPVTTGATVVAVGAGGHQRGTHTFSSSDLSDFHSEGHNSLFDATSGIGHIPNWTSGAVDPAAWTFSSTTQNTYTYASITFALRPA